MNTATDTASYVPGEAYAVVAADVAVLVKDADATTIARLWEAAATPDVMALLDILGKNGFASMPEFAAVVRSGSDLRVVTRGAAAVRLELAGQETICDAVGVATWSEQRLVAEDAAGVRLTLGSSTGGEEWPLVAGVVRAAEVAFGSSVPAGEPVAAPEPEAAPAVPEPAVEEPEPEEAPVEEPESEAAPVIPEPEPEAAPVIPEPEPVVPVPVAPVPVAPEPVDPAQTIAEPDEASFDALFGATIAGRRPEDAAVRVLEEPDLAESPEPTPSVEPAPSSEPAAEDHTMTPEEFARLRARNRGNASTEPQPSSPSVGPPATLTFSTGREVRVDRPVLVGRSPQARNLSSSQLPHLVVVDDPYVSGTHLELAMVGTELQATDVSTNGTLMQRSVTDSPSAMTRDEPTPIPHGAVLHVSESVTITVALEGHEEYDRG